MWLLIFIVAVIAVLVLLVHTTVELNKVDKGVSTILERLRIHYEP